MTGDLPRFVVSLGAAVAVVAVARSRRSLSRSGAVAAVAVGTAVVAGGGWSWGVVLVLFFATSSALPNVGGRRSRGTGVAARGAERDAVQVLANGAVAGSVSLLAARASLPWQGPLFAAFVGAVEAATADTWATEIGSLSRTPPRLVVCGRTVPPGTSGGVTVTGSLAAIAGAVLIAVAAAIGVAAGWAAGDLPCLLAGATLAGIVGAFADSLLGATVQAGYCCPSCAEPTERRVHRCGTQTRLVRGHPAVTNDVVNAAATLVGAPTGATLAWLAG